MPSFNMKKLDQALGSTTGLTVGLGATGFLALTSVPFAASALIFGGVALGSIPFCFADYAISSGLDKFLSTNYPKTNKICQFSLMAASTVLSVFVGLAAMSLVATLLVNPFIVPMFIAAGVSAGVMLGLAGFVVGMLGKQYHEYRTNSAPLENAIQTNPSFRSVLVTDVKIDPAFSPQPLAKSGQPSFWSQKIPEITARFFNKTESEIFSPNFQYS